MTKKCNICASPVSQSELKCVLCRHYFHIKCVKLEVTDAAIINKNNLNIHWFCDECNIFTQSDFLSSLLTKVNKLEKFVEKIDGNVSSLMDNQPKNKKQADNNTTPASNTRSKIVAKKIVKDSSQGIALVAHTSNKKPAADESIVVEDPHNATFRDMLVSGNDQTSEEAIENSVNAPRSIEERRWIFVSRLHPNTSSENLSKWLKRELRSDNVLCFPLIPRGIPTTDLRMISFKVGVPQSLLELVKDRKLWPPGIQLRDFVVRTVSIPVVEDAL